MLPFSIGLDRVVTDAIERLSNAIGRTLRFEDVEVKMWQQLWPNEQTGFSTSEPNKLTTAYAIVVIDRFRMQCVVYHNYRFAYRSKWNVLMRDGVRKQSLPGAVAYYKEKREADYKNRNYTEEKSRRLGGKG